MTSSSASSRPLNDMIYDRSNDKGLSVIEGTDSSSDYTFTKSILQIKAGSSQSSQNEYMVV